MDSVHDIPQRFVDHPVTVDAALACKGGSCDLYMPMAFARAVVTRMSRMAMALVDDT